MHKAKLAQKYELLGLGVLTGDLRNVSIVLLDALIQAVHRAA